MSVARITTVKAARKPQGECNKCGKAINVGDGYLHFTIGFRSRFKRVRCLGAACFPRPSERESSAKATPMAAVEDFAASEFANLDDLRSGFEEVAAAFREYADECESALDAWENGNYQLEERRDGAEEAASMVEDWEPEEYEGDVDDDGEPLDPDDYAEHVTEQQNAAEELLADAEGAWI